MNVLIVCEFVKASRWAGSAWAVDVARGLSERGHRVVVACDGVDDPTGLDPAIVLQRGRPRRSEHRRPMAFARWADNLVRRGSQDVSLSFSPLVSADVWCPVEQGAWRFVRMLMRQRSPASFFMGLTHSMWLPGALIAEQLVRRRGVLAPIGVESSHGGLGFASSMTPPEDAPAVRRRVRETLGLSESRPVLVMSSVHHAQPGLDDMLRGLAQVDVTPAPVVLVLGREGYSVHARARRAGCERLLRLLGGTSRMDAAILAADAALAPLARSTGSTGRFVADCLRLGTPVVADEDAPGVELLRPRAFGSAPVGLIVDRGDDWSACITRIISEGWLESTRRAASDVGAALTMDAFLTRLEHLLSRGRQSEAMPRGPFLPATRS